MMGRWESCAVILGQLLIDKSNVSVDLYAVMHAAVRQEEGRT